MAAVVDIKTAARKLWIEVGPLDAVPPMGARVVRLRQGDIAVFRTRDDRVFALDDRCPHKGGPLSQGIVTGCKVICPLHDWCVSLESGEADAPDEGRSGSYPVKVRDGTIYLCLN